MTVISSDCWTCCAHFFELAAAEGAGAVIFCECVHDLFDWEIWLRPRSVSALGLTFAQVSFF